jgi:hypothetical protein
MNLFKQRNNISSPSPSFEGMKGESDNISGVSNLSNTSYPLKEYFIKSSYNSAYSGTSVSTNNVIDIIKRGCRFLDFEVFYIDGKAQVAYSTDTSRINIDSDNCILLSDVFDTLITNGFANAPNSGDPLFIQLRIKSKPVIDAGIFPLIIASIQSKIGNRLYQGSVSGETPIQNLMGKIVLVIDQKTCPELSEHNDLVALTNMVSSGKQLHKYSYSTTIQMATTPITANSDGTTNVSKTMKIVEPDSDVQNSMFGKLIKYGNTISYIVILAIIIIFGMTVYYIMTPSNFSIGKTFIEKIQITLLTFLAKYINIFAFFIFILILGVIVLFSNTTDGNPSVQSLISDYGIQIVEYKFYLQDNALKEYENVFRNAGTAFIPFSKII